MSATKVSPPFTFPQLFLRRKAGASHRIYVVVLPDYYDWEYYWSEWQRNPDFPNGEMYKPGIDILSKDKTWIYDSPDAAKNFSDAIEKMKELWAQVDF